MRKRCKQGRQDSNFAHNIYEESFKAEIPSCLTRLDELSTNLLPSTGAKLESSLSALKGFRLTMMCGIKHQRILFTDCEELQYTILYTMPLKSNILIISSLSVGRDL
jgi:hypothetical protein